MKRSFLQLAFSLSFLHSPNYLFSATSLLLVANVILPYSQEKLFHTTKTISVDAPPLGATVAWDNGSTAWGNGSTPLGATAPPLF